MAETRENNMITPNEREDKVKELHEKLLAWVRENISPELLKSGEMFGETLRIIARDKRGELEEIAAALGAEAQRGLRLSLSGGDKGKGDVWLSVWPDKAIETKTAIHGYAESKATLHIVRGAAHEDVYGVMPSGKKDDGEAIPVMKMPSFPTEGSTLTVSPHYIHSLAGAEGGGTLTTLNGFFPALESIEIYEEEQDGENLSLKKVATIKVDDSVISIDFSSASSNNGD